MLGVESMQNGSRAFALEPICTLYYYTSKTAAWIAGLRHAMLAYVAVTMPVIIILASPPPFLPAQKWTSA